MAARLERLLLGATDYVFGVLPRRLPDAAQLARCRLVAHRGERDDQRVLENTYAAFDCLRGRGIYGIEFDVRWTRDLVPVVAHDPDLFRLFGQRRIIAQLDREELHRLCPEVPDLHSFVRRYTDEFHLMVELKAEDYPQPERQQARLLEALAPALERERCHVLALDPRLFERLPLLPARRTLSVARFNTEAISREALASGRAGIAAHYALLSPRAIARHHAAGQQVGSGFAHSRAVLLRELGRGVDWVFTNRALDLQRLLVELRRAIQ